MDWVPDFPPNRRSVVLIELDMLVNRRPEEKAGPAALDWDFDKLSRLTADINYLLAKIALPF